MSRKKTEKVNRVLASTMTNVTDMVDGSTYDELPGAAELVRLRPNTWYFLALNLYSCDENIVQRESFE